MSRARRTSLTLLLPLLLAPALAAAQPRPASNLPAPAEHRFAVEAAGGVVGSLAGVGLAVAAGAARRCGVDDLGCVIRDVALIGAVSTAGSAAGAYGVWRWRRTEPSGLGATLGAVVGVAAGVGAMQLVEEAGIRPNNVVRTVIYSTAQGLVTALGSRLLSRGRGGR